MTRGDFMRIEEKLKWHGHILAVVRDHETKIIKKRKIIQNQITDSALDEIIKGLYASSPDIEIKEMAFGDGTTAPSSSDSTLVNETYRVSNTELGRTDTGQVTSEFVLNYVEYLAVQPSGVINEIGIFAGTSAAVWGGGAGKDTGLLIARVLFPYTLLSGEEIFFQRIDNMTA